MKGIYVVYRKELYRLFASPIFYVVAFIFLALVGYFFYSSVAYYSLLSFQAGRNPFLSEQLNLTDMVLEPFFGSISVVLLLMVPLITMRLFAEEKKTGTIELLMTSPISSVQVLLGKFFACFSLYAIIVSLTMVYFAILEAYGSPDWGPIFSGYLGYLFLGATFISVGILASALTENQIVAVLLSFGILLLFWLIDWSASFAGPTAAKILQYVSFIEHLEDFQRGVIDTRDVIFYLSFTFFCLFLTTRVIESRRWRR